MLVFNQSIIFGANPKGPFAEINESYGGIIRLIWICDTHCSRTMHRGLGTGLIYHHLDVSIRLETGLGNDVAMSILVNGIS
jgi:hypothetical protein